MRKLVTTTHLEMRDRASLRPPRAGLEPPGFSVVRAEVACPELNRFFYLAVGGDWLWYERVGWTRERWLGWLSRPEVETWIGYQRGTPAGYFELERQGDSVEIAYFGLLPSFVGSGLGGALLHKAASRGFDLGAARVWVHTCDLDHPSALANYRARGFQVFDTVEAFEEVPEKASPFVPG
ncbi:MAG: GNAT family N-acetyltransferase [Polyangiaceae bacterium]